MSVDQWYANGRIAVMSTRLFGADKYTRLAESNTLSEAVRVLAESGYGAGIAVTDPNDYEQMLVAELDGALKTLKELCGNKYALKYFLCKYDYLNAKILMKCKYMRADGVGFCYKQAEISPEFMNKAVLNDDYSDFPQNMAEACDEIDTAYAEGRRSPSIIDVTLDKAMFRDMRIYAQKCRFKYGFIRDIFVYYADTVNLMLLYRARKAGFDKETFADMIAEGGKISKETLLTLYENETKTENLDAEYKGFYALCVGSNADLAAAENEQKSKIFKIIKDNADLATIQPVLEYFFLKVGEIERIRRALVAVKSGVDKDKIKDMLK